ncbi:MAG: hypothetical protein ACO3L8_04480, partial [Ilumatobacteraceae bacterium]
TTPPAPPPTSTTSVPRPTETPPNPANLPVGQMTSNTNVSAGTSMTVAAGGFAPNELVGIFTVTDTDIDTIAATTATNEGTVTAEITMPSDACGEVNLIAWAPGSGVGVHQTVNVTQCAASEEVSDDRLPVTGDENNLAMWALLFAALGGLATLRVRTPR